MFTTRDFLGILVWFGLTFAAAFLGSRFLPDQWYASLKKPTWNPPNRLFAPVWTILYLLMALAAWMVWRANGIQAAILPLALFVLQLGLNAAWTWLFFGLHRPRLALMDILGLWLVLAIMLITFWKVQPLAGGLLLPYLAWVSFAACLNYTVYKLNPAGLQV